jgi:Raf kinase inhibitor-like YbhB/YbcL family protein
VRWRAGGALLMVLAVVGCNQPAGAPAGQVPSSPAAGATAAAAAKPVASAVASAAATVAAVLAPSPTAGASPSAAVSPVASAAASPAAGASPSPSPLAAGSPVAIPAMLLTGTPTPDFVLQSSAFADGATLPTEFTCAGAQTSPPLAWSGAPAATKAFVLVEQDADVPPPNGPVVHWILYNIPATQSSLAAGLPKQDALADGSGQGVNALRSIGYIGSCPPPGAAPHHYVFQLFALDAPLALKAEPTIVDLQSAMAGHVLAQTALRATFGR